MCTTCLKLRVRVLFHASGALANDTWLVFLPFAPLKTTSASLLILAFVTVMLSIISLLMLGHLLGFHFYLCKKRLEEVLSCLNPPSHFIVFPLVPPQFTKA